jgi:hypothetical protein
MSLLPFSSAPSTGGGGGTVTSVSVVTANGISGSVANPTTTPAITLTLGAITPTTVNSITLSGSSTPALAVTGTSSISGANTGDQTITLTGGVTGSGTGSFATTVITNANLTGPVTSSGNATSIANSIALPASPTTTTQSPADNSTKIATTAYVDNAILGQRTKEAVKYASTAALPSIVYANGSSGVGATLTGVALAAISLDSSSPAVNDRVLIKNQVSTFQNGIYTVTATGSGIAVFVLTRTNDFDQASDIQTGDTVFVTAGSTLANTTWTYNGIDSPVMGTDAITFAQAAGPGSYTAGNGISITGVSIAIDTSITVDKNTSQTLTNKTLTSPTLTTPSLGVATATSINKVAITAPASSATLTIPDGVTLTGPASSGTAMTLGNTETVTGVKTFGGAGAVGRFKLAGTTSGTTVLDASATASGTLTLPAATDTLVGKATTDTLTNKTYDTAGTGNSFSINGVAATANTGTGSVVRAASPTITTPTIADFTNATHNHTNAAGGGLLNLATADTTAWGSWTPTWANLTAGNGTNASTYRQIGTTVFYNVLFTLGSTSSVGSNPTFTFPVTSATLNTNQMIGQAVYQNTSGWHNGFANWSTTTTATIRTWDGNNDGGAVTATSPFGGGWLTNYVINVWGFYKTA